MIRDSLKSELFTLLTIGKIKKPNILCYTKKKFLHDYGVTFSVYTFTLESITGNNQKHNMNFFKVQYLLNIKIKGTMKELHDYEESFISVIKY